MSTVVLRRKVSVDFCAAAAGWGLVMLTVAPAWAEKGVSLQRDPGDPKTVIGRVEMARDLS
jgi:hypothetical protein